MRRMQKKIKKIFQKHFLQSKKYLFILSKSYLLVIFQKVTLCLLDLIEILFFCHLHLGQYWSLQSFL